MSGVFYISGLNGLRWTLESFTPDPNLNSLPVGSEIDLQSYAAPIQKTDTAFPALVLLSDFPDMNLEFLTCDEVPIANPTLGATSSSIINQTFLQYLAIVDFSAFPTGRCYGRISYDSNLPASLAGALTELLSPFIDGNLIVFNNAIETDLINGGQTYSGKITPGNTYQFVAQSLEVSTATNPRIRLTVTRILNGISQVIFDKSEICTGSNDFGYTGTAQPGAAYSAIVTTEDTAVAISPINIPDNAPVTPDIQSYISCPIDVQENHPQTQLIQYQNSENTESVLFHPSELILQTRIEGNFTGGYQPKANIETFEDQPYNPVLLNGFNYDIYTHYLTGDEIQLPDWRIKQLNLIWAKCDQVKIDYDFYVSAGDFKGERPEYTFNRNGTNWQKDLQIVAGYEFGQLTAGTTPTGDLIVVRKTWPAKPPFTNITTSIVINGVFTQFSNIDYLQTTNPGLATFNMKVGKTLGGGELFDGEIGTPNADDSVELIETHDLGAGFDAPTDIYITIPDGAIVCPILVYDQLDSPAVVAGAGAAGVVPQGAIGYYKELVAGYFTRDWDIATGLGQVGSQWEGFQIYDEAAGKVLVAWDRSTIDPDKGRGTPGVTGALQTGVEDNELTLTRDMLPAEGLLMFTTDRNTTAGDQPTGTSHVASVADSGGTFNYEVRKGVSEAVHGLTENMGAGTAINIGNDGLIMLCWIKL